MSGLSIRLSRSIIATTFVNIIFLVLSSFVAPILAQTTTSATATRAATRSTTSTIPPYSVLPFFLPDSEPHYLVASVVHKTTIITTTIVSLKTTVTSISTQTLSFDNPDPEDEITLQIDCPTASTPENEACRSAKIYPAFVTGRRVAGGSAGGIAQSQVWKGETTYLVGDDATTTWSCWQGMSMRTAAPAPTEAAAVAPLAAVDRGGGMVPYAQCVSTIVQDQGSYVRFVTRRYDECYFYRHMVPLVVVGDDGRPDDGIGEAGRLNNGWDSRLAGLRCDVQGAERTMWAGSVKTQVAAVTGTSVAATSGGAASMNGQFLRSIGWMVFIWPLAVALMGSWIH
ncbi:hypothetical protein V8F20_010921 [Naviculisporaceae sp. PSN 640]